MDTINHLGFIVASYAAAFVVVCVLIAWVALDYRAQRRKLAELEMRGVTRRSTPARADAKMEQAKEKV
jgi:heme exporter protein D